MARGVCPILSFSFAFGSYNYRGGKERKVSHILSTKKNIKGGLRECAPSSFFSLMLSQCGELLRANEISKWLWVQSSVYLWRSIQSHIHVWRWKVEHVCMHVRKCKWECKFTGVPLRLSVLARVRKCVCKCGNMREMVQVLVHAQVREWMQVRKQMQFRKFECVNTID